MIRPLLGGERFSSTPRYRRASTTLEGSYAAQESRIPGCDSPWYLSYKESARVK